MAKFKHLCFLIVFSTFTFKLVANLVISIVSGSGKSSKTFFVGNFKLVSVVYQLSATVERLPLFSVATVVMPLFLLHTVSCLSVILPAITGDRIALLLSCLLATVIYLETTFKYIPVSSTNFPIIIWLILVNLIMTGIQIILAGVCLNWANKECHRKKPGKKLIFIMFVLLKFILFLPKIAYSKIKLCSMAIRRRKVAEIDDNQSEEQQDGRSDEKEDGIRSETDECLETKEKSYRNAIKIVDGLAILLALFTLATLPIITCAIFVFTFKNISWFCEGDIDWFTK